MFGPDFYPTPSKVAKLMLAKINKAAAGRNWVGMDTKQQKAS